MFDKSRAGQNHRGALLLFIDARRNISAIPDDIARAHDLDVQIQDRCHVRYDEVANTARLGFAP